MSPNPVLHHQSIREAVDFTLEREGADPKNYRGRATPLSVRTDCLIHLTVAFDGVMAAFTTLSIPVRTMRQATLLPCYNGPIGREASEFAIEEWHELELPEPYVPLAHEVFLNDFHGVEQGRPNTMRPEMREWLQNSIVGHVRWNGLFGFSFNELEDAVLFKLRWFK